MLRIPQRFCFCFIFFFLCRCKAAQKAQTVVAATSESIHFSPTFSEAVVELRGVVLLNRRECPLFSFKSAVWGQGPFADLAAPFDKIVIMTLLNPLPRSNLH